MKSFHLLVIIGKCFTCAPLEVLPLKKLLNDLKQAIFLIHTLDVKNTFVYGLLPWNIVGGAENYIGLSLIHKHNMILRKKLLNISKGNMYSFGEYHGQ